MNVTQGETRIARLENGVLSELIIQRDNDQQVAGNIYFGRITRVLPGMQAAFVDIGLEKAAFLYVADIVPDLFEGIDEDEEAEDIREAQSCDEGPSLVEIPSENEGTHLTENHEPAALAVNDNGPQAAPIQNDIAHKRNPRGRKFSRPKRGPLPRIENLVKEGQTIVVQVVKEPMRTKGARITSHISLPGRFLVSMPTVNHVGVSRRVSSFEERSRLKRILHDNKPANGGFIARTNCVEAPEDKLVEDITTLKETWQKIYEKTEKSRAPALLYSDLPLVLRAVRDNFTKDVDRLVIDSKDDHAEVMELVEKFMPDLKNRVQLYDKDTPLFDVYGVETEINRALGKKVWLKSGGYLIIETAEALTSIDVNTGRFVGKKDFEETIMTTNMEAVIEVAYQLKLRSIGGIIIIDFIDMGRHSNRAKVYNAMRDALRRDRIKTTISKISELGLIEMTRKRTRDSLTQMLSEICPHCHGTGSIKTPQTVAFEVFREIKRVFHGVSGRQLLVVTNPRVAKVLFNEGRAYLESIEKRIGKRVIVETDEARHVDDFEIRSRDKIA